MSSSPLDAQAPSVAAGTLRRIAAIGPRFQSYNVEMAEVTGGNFWKPYTRETVASLTAKAKQASAGAPTAFGGKVGQDTTMFQKRPPLDLTNARFRPPHHGGVPLAVGERGHGAAAEGC